MTLDDLIEEFRTQPTTHAGIRAVVEALRDDAWSRADTMMWDGQAFKGFFHEILTSDGAVKAAGGSTRKDECALQSQVTPSPAADVCEWRGGPQLAYMGCKPRELEWTYDRRKCPSCGKPIRFVEVKK